MDLFIERELPKILDLKNGTSHDVLFIPDTYIYNELTEKVRNYVHDLKVHVWAHMLPNTVAVLSLGLLVDDLGFSYHWTPKEKPYLEKGESKSYLPPI